jgi:hypothetical protein
MRQFDPLQAFLVRSMNGREARESGLRLKGKVVPGPTPRKRAANASVRPQADSVRGRPLEFARSRLYCFRMPSGHLCQD